MRNRFVVALPLLAAFSALAACQQYSPPAAAESANQSASSVPSDTAPQPVADAAGNIHVPDGYQTSYQYLGSWAIASDSGQGAKEMHDVYASPGTIDVFRRTGRFPDGAVLVKEVYETETKPMTTGTVSHATKLKGWFVMVKDYDNSHPDNKLWGDGWGWSWFDADNPAKTTSTDYTTDCQSCHEPAKATDWIYTEGYAPLRQ
jgi:hypothetical protein